MTHLFDTSAIRAHHLAESGADRVQALIAAVAVLRNATLVHRDLHFTAIPPASLAQEMLSQK